MIDCPAEEIPKDQITYIAGYLDGEGCFTYPKKSPRVYVSNTHKPTLDNFQKYFGGTIRLRDRGAGDTRDGYEWSVYGDRAIAVLETMLPYLQEKQAQAALMLARRRESRGEAREKLERMLGELKRL